MDQDLVEGFIHIIGNLNSKNFKSFKNYVNSISLESDTKAATWIPKEYFLMTKMEIWNVKR